MPETPPPIESTDPDAIPAPEEAPAPESGEHLTPEDPPVAIRGGDPNVGMVRDTVQTFAAQFITILVSIISSVILGRSIAPTGKGLFTILILIPKSAWTFGTFGLDQVNTVYAGREPERRHELATTTLFLGVVASILAYAIVTVLMFWPGKGAAKVDIRPGDFLTHVDGVPYALGGAAQLLEAERGAAGTTLPVTIWRQGKELPRTIPIEPQGAAGTYQPAVDFRLSALNTWRYGLTINPRFATQAWNEALEFGVLALTDAHWDEIELRQERGLQPPHAQWPLRQPALLVGGVGPEGKLNKIKRAGQPRPDLRVGDIILAIDGVPVHIGDPDAPLTIPQAAESLRLRLFRKGEELEIEWPVRDDIATNAWEARPLPLAETGLRHYGLNRNLHWQEMEEFPHLGMAIAPITVTRRDDLERREALPGAFAEGTDFTDGALITQVDYPWLRRWAQDLPRNLFMLTMLFFPLTATAYLMDSILYGLNLILLRNQKSVITAAVLAVLYAIGLYGYGTVHLGLSYRNPEELMQLIHIGVVLTLIHGVFISAYSYYLIAPRAHFAAKYLNFPYIRECFRHIGWQSYIANSASYLFYDVDVFIITAIIAGGASTLTLDNLGNYTQATNIVERVWIIPGAIATALLPKLTNYGIEKAGELTPKSVRHTLILTIAILIPLMLLMPTLVPLLWGPEFLPLLGPFYLLAPGILLFSLSKVYSSHLLGIGLPKYAMYYSVLSVIVNVIMNFLLIPNESVVGGVAIGGINGAAIASTVAYSLHSFLMMEAYCREAQVRPAQVFRYTRDDWNMYVRGYQGTVQFFKKLRARS